MTGRRTSARSGRSSASMFGNDVAKARSSIGRGRLYAEISILKAIGDPRLFGSAFKDISTWRAWMAFLAALFGIALSG